MNSETFSERKRLFCTVVMPVEYAELEIMQKIFYRRASVDFCFHDQQIFCLFAPKPTAWKKNAISSSFSFGKQIFSQQSRLPFFNCHIFSLFNRILSSSSCTRKSFLSFVTVFLEIMNAQSLLGFHDHTTSTTRPN